MQNAVGRIVQEIHHSNVGDKMRPPPAHGGMKLYRCPLTGYARPESVSD